MEFKKFLYILAFLAIFAMAVRVSTASDTFWHLRAGEWIVENQQILDSDPFSLTRQGESWEYPGWLPQILLSLMYRALGFPGLNLFTTLFVLTAFVFVGLATSGRDSVRITVLLLAAVTSSVYWSARPHIVTFALTGFFIWVLESYRTDKKNILLTLPIAMAVWGNVHGGFASGFILIFCYLLGEVFETLIPVIKDNQTIAVALQTHKRRLFHYAGIGLISAAAISLNPHGPMMLLYPFQTVGIESLQDYIQEWQSPNFHQAQVYPFVLSILFLLLAFATTEKKISAHAYILNAVFLVLALSAARNIALFALVTVPALTEHLSSGLAPLLDRLRSKEEFRPELVRSLNLVLLALSLIAVGIKISVPLNPSNNSEILHDIYPYEAANYLRNIEPQGTMFNSYNWGSFILWELYPKYPSFVDGRTDLFNDEILQAYLEAWRGEPTWRDLFDRWDIQLVFIETDAPLRFQLELAGWRAVYVDDQAAILVP